MAGKITSYGRVCYVEPNAYDNQSNVRVNTDGKESGFTIADTQLMHDYEDLQMAVDLLIETRSRYDYQGESSNSGSALVRNKRLAHFIGGHYDQSATTWYLTTDYTDYDERTIMKGMNNESIGIKSISINYTNYFRPEVSIEFVDVRGASFMLPEESAYINQLRYETNHGYTGMYTDMKKGSFFSSLLSFPPPCFYLRVKGFYGNAVTFRLCLESSKIAFDHNNGNFNITTKFIGYQYAILTDIPFSLIYLAEKCTDGYNIFKQKNFKFKGRNEGISIPTIDEYILKVNDVVNDNIKAFNDEPSCVALRKESAISVALSSLRNLFVFQKWPHWIYSSTEKKYVGAYNIGAENNPSNGYNELLNQVAKFKAACNLYKNEIGALPPCIDSFINKLNAKDTNGDGKIDPDYSFYVKTDEGGNRVIGDMKKGKKEETERYITNYGISLDGVNDGDVFALYIIESSIDCDEELDNLKNEYSKKIEKLTKTVQDSSLLFVENKMGFAPSIKNINSIIFAGLETFINLMFYTLKTVWQETKAGNRKYKTFIKSEEDTDVNSSETAELPPFPLFSKTVSTKQGPKKVMLFPTEYDSRLVEMPEVQLVYELLKTAKTNGIQNKYNKEKQEAALVDDNTVVVKDKNVVPKMNGLGYYNFYPTTIYDLVLSSPYKTVTDGEASYNPYDFIKDGVLETEIQNWLYSTFMCRDTYVEQSIDIQYLILKEKYEKTAKTFGAIEAQNAYISLRDKYTYKDLFPNDNSPKAYKLSLSSKDNMFEDDRYKWVKTISGDVFLPIGLYDEDNIIRYRQVGDKSENKNYFLKYSNNLSKYPNIESYRLGYKKNIDLLVNSYGAVKYSDSDTDTVNPESLFLIDKSRDYELYTHLNYHEGGNTHRTIGSLMDDEAKDCIFDIHFSNVTDYSAGLDEESIKTYSAPIFLTSLYYEQETFEAKMYLFLMSIRTIGIGGFINGGRLNGFVPYFDYLAKLASCWRAYQFRKNDIDPIKNAEKYGLGVYNLNRARLDANVRDMYTFEGRGSSLCLHTPESENENAFEDYNVYVGINKYTAALYSKMISISEELKKIDSYFSLKKSGTETFTVDDFKNFDAVKFAKFNPQYKIVNSNLNNSDEASNNAINPISERDGVYYANNIDIADYSSSSYKEISDCIYSILGEFRYQLDYLVCSLGDAGVPVNNYNALESHGNNKFRDIAWREFKACLQKLYGANQIKEDGADNRIEAQTEDSTTDYDGTKSNDIRLNTYLTLKYIYERWICSTGPEDWNVLDENNKYRKFKFEYLDSYYKDIGDDLMVTMEFVSDKFKDYRGDGNGEKLNNTSINTLIGDITKKCSCMYLSVPFMFGQTRNSKDLCDLFDAKPLNSITFEDQFTFVVMYAYKPSDSLDMGKHSEKKNDGFDLADTLGNMSPKLPSQLSSENSDSSTGSTHIIPAFGVTYGRQAQSYFENITLDTNIPQGGASQYTIMSQVNIAAGASESQTKNGIYGQDMYRVFSNYAYICKVKMLGDAMISPLMYFQLNNIPMWKGAYIINKVTHTISPGNMETEFEGWRVSKYANRIIDPLPVSSSLNGRDNASGEDGVGGEGDGKSKKEETKEPKNDNNSGNDGNDFDDCTRIELAKNVVFDGLKSASYTNSDGEAKSEQQSYLYTYLIMTLADTCESKEDMQNKFNELMNSEEFKNEYGNISQNFYVDDNDVEGVHKIKNPSNNGKPSANDWLQQKAVEDGRKVIVQKENLTVTDLMKFLNTDSNFKEGDVVFYFYEPIGSSSEASSDGDIEPIVGSGDQRRYPSMTQIYHNCENYKWVAHEKKLPNSFYYYDTKIEGTNKKVTDVRRARWTVVVYGKRN